MQAIFSIPLILIFLFILAFISFFFSASETAIIGLSKIRLRHMIAQGVRRAQSIQRLVTKLDKFIAAILIGNDFVNISISAILTAIFVYLLGYRWGVFTSTLISTFFVLIICEITPKILATKHTEKIALLTAPVMELFIKIFRPVIFIFTFISNLILKILGIETSKRSPLITEEELRLMIEIGKEEGVLTDEERKMLHRIFEFGDTKIGEVMIPKEKIIAVNINSNAQELIDKVIEEGYARLPVYKESIDNIVGIIYSQNLLYLRKEEGLFVVHDLIFPVHYTSPSTKVSELLRKFQADRIQIAIVTDEQNRTLGLVTLEDLLEEIVGEIEEEPKRHK